MEQKIHISLDDRTRVQMSSGSSDYNELSNKPQINGVTLENNKTAQELNLATNTDLERYFGLYFKSVDYVFAGINPELELLENPVQVVINSAGRGYVNLDYPLDLVEGKNYHIKATIGKLDGSVEEYESDITAQRLDTNQPIALYEAKDQKTINVVDKAKLTPTGSTEADENASVVMASDDGEVKVWSYVTFTSIVQKEKTSANLLKEPIVVTQEEIDAGGSTGVQKTLNKAIGLEIDKIYDLTIVQNGVETIVTAGTIDAKSMLGTDFSFSGIITFSGLNNSIIAIVMYDGVDKSSGEPVQADKAMIQFLPTSGTMGAFELTSIQEHTNLEDWSIPLVVTIDNPQKAPYYKYYNKTGSLFDGEGENGRVKITGSYVIDGQAHSFEEGEYVQLGGGGALYVDCLIEEPRHHIAARFSIADGALGVDNAFTANYVTLLIDNASVDGSPVSELRIDSITAE